MELKGGKKDFEKLWNEINIYKNSHENDKERLIWEWDGERQKWEWDK